MAANSGFSSAVMSKLITDCDTVFDDPYLEEVLKQMLSTKPESRSKLYHLHLEVVNKFRTLGIKEKPRSRRKSSSEDAGKILLPQTLLTKKNSFRRASVDANQKLAVTEKKTATSRRASRSTVVKLTSQRTPSKIRIARKPHELPNRGEAKPSEKAQP